MAVVLSRGLGLFSPPFDIGYVVAFIVGLLAVIFIPAVSTRSL